MSHWTEIKTEISDLHALELACAELGLRLQAGGTVRGYGQNQLTPEFAIACPGPYDIAVSKAADGKTYALTTDWYMGHVAKAVGENYGKLLQAYGAHKAALAAKAKGFSAQIMRSAQDVAKFNAFTGQQLKY